jgi:hypothetical protein
MILRFTLTADMQCEVLVVVHVTVLVFQDVVCSRDNYCSGISTPPSRVKQVLHKCLTT